MNLNFLLKNADNKDIKINILKSWVDAFNNLIIVMEIKGKKYSVHKSSPAAGEEWSYFYGVGSSKKTSDMPAGRGDYLLGPKVGPISAKKISEVVKDSNLSSEFIQNKGGVSWSPKNKEEKEGLAKLVGMGGKINAYLSSSGIGYKGGDKLLFGEDVDTSDVLNWRVPINVPSEPLAEKVRSTSPSGNPSSSQGIFGSIAPRWNGKNGYTLGPQYHQARGLGNWPSDNAWDIEGSPGTQVYSLSCGTVSKMHESGTSNPKIYGTQISISGDSGYPSVFYTHLEGASIKVGDRVEVGTPIAKIKMPLAPKMPPHVHIGLSGGAISDLVTESGKFITREDK